MWQQAQQWLEYQQGGNMSKWQALQIKAESTLHEAVMIIDRGAIGAVIVVDEQDHLLGIVTDGDVRRGLLKNFDMQTTIDKVMNTQPKVVKEGESRQHSLHLMQRLGLRHMPIVNDSNQVVGLELLDMLMKPKQYDNPVIIMAGGMGTRLQPLTNNCPKPLLPIDSKPMLEIILESFIEYGFHQFIFSLHYRGEMIRDYFKQGEKWSVTIDYIEEKNPLGTAGALSLLEQPPSQPFIVMNGDIITRVNFQHLIDFHQAHHCHATVCVREYQHTIPYGVVNIHKNQLVQLQEKPSQSCFVNAGIYVLDPAMLPLVENNQYCDMTDLLNRMIKAGMRTHVFPIREYWSDIGQLQDYQQAHKDYQEYFI